MVNTLNHEGNANQSYTKIASLPSQIGHCQENKQMLVRLWGKGALRCCWWQCKLVQPCGNQHGGSSKS
jgi:hypothetical protein